MEIQSTGQGYLLRADGLWSDVETFTRTMTLAAAALRARDRETASARYRDALDLYGGSFLPADDSEWTVYQRECFRTQALLAVRHLWREAIDAGDSWSALAWSQRALEIDPDDLETYDLLVAASQRLGLGKQADRWNDLARSRFADV